MDPAKRGRDKPFTRPDRVHFPAMTRAMWECPMDDSFGTPEITGQLPCEGEAARAGTPPPGWTPSSRDLSRLTPQGASDGRSADVFFYEREHRGLITPSRTPGDFMLRGSLFDPFSQSGSSSRSRVSEAGLTPSSASAASGPRSGGATGQDGRSPAIRAVRFSPDLATNLSRPVSSSKRRAMEAQTRISFSPIEERSPKDDSNWSISPVGSPAPVQSGAREAEFGKSTGVTSAPSAAISGSSLPPPPVAIVLSGSAQHNAANSVGALRENDSLSVSSISFGKDDARMRVIETRDPSGCQPLLGPNAPTIGCQASGGQAAVPARPPEVVEVQGTLHPRSRLTPTSGCQGQADAVPKESVARQLDFDADGTPLRASIQQAFRRSAAPSSPSAPTVQLRNPTVPVRTRDLPPSSPSAGITVAQAQRSSPLPVGPASYMCASGSDLEPADWDSSLSREVMPVMYKTGGSSTLASKGCRRAGTGFGPANASVADYSPGMTLRELSPLRSEGGYSSLAIASQESSLSQILAAEAATEAGTECPCCGSRRRSASVPIEASALEDGRPVPIAVERLDSFTEAGSIMLQLRLGTRRSDCQEPWWNPCAASDEARNECKRGASSTSRSRSQSRKKSPPSPEKGLDVISCGTSLCSWPEGPTRCQSAPQLSAGVMSRSVSAPHFGTEGTLHSCTACGVPLESQTKRPRERRSGDGEGMQLQAIRSKYMGVREPSLEELHYTVQALRQRYLQRYFQAKPLHHPPCLGSNHPLARASSDSQLLRPRRRHAASCGARQRSGRARKGSRLRCRSG